MHGVIVGKRVRTRRLSDRYCTRFWMSGMFWCDQQDYATVLERRVRTKSRDYTGCLHLWSKFGDPSLKGWRVIAPTSKWLPHGRTDTQTDAGNDNTRRPKLASGKNSGLNYSTMPYILLQFSLITTQVFLVTEFMMISHRSEVLALWRHICQLFLHAQVGAKTIFTSE